MNRLDLIHRLLTECTQSAAWVNNFLEKPRKYDAAEDSLYMREVHFVVAVGPDATPTMSEMAQKLNVTQSAVTQMVTRLEKKGYVQRTKSADDKRVTAVYLTEKGVDLYHQHIRYDLDKYESVSQKLQDMSNEDLEEFIYYVRCIRRLFTN